ncbi:uncharacterized protein LOC127245429 [Andrographis paniculata]|uniref:uncharacterized protein LOC127245429 n=1 Tax=Andrographis paniculata TaxID=175694 RepID=UPI0021E757BF|nr:uncharacterized protein LOC127245429 [Andrographis paniculata]
MSKHYIKKHVLYKNTSTPMERKKPHQQTSSFFSKHFKKIYPIELKITCSPLSLSSLSLSLSQNSSDSSLTASSETFDPKIPSALTLITLEDRRREEPVAKINAQKPISVNPTAEEWTRRCNWITKTSDELYVQFHDECWGVPTYDDNKMFELLTMCGMLMDFNWTDILKRRQLLREAFAGFDPDNVARMGEQEIVDIASNKELALAECRIRCIVVNAKCIRKVAKEHGSFSSYMWDHVSYKPLIKKFRYPRNVPLRSSKGEVISKDLVSRGFRLVGPVIVYSFMQASGMTIDHLVDCFRYGECVNLAERPWRHV